MADDLFISAAEMFGERALVVVPSGEHDDGAAGVRAIRRHGGRVLVQDQASDRAFRMPAAAISTGCVDVVLPSKGIARALIAFTMAPGAAGFVKVPVAPWAVLAAPASPFTPRRVSRAL